MTQQTIPTVPSERTLAQWLAYLESIHPTAIDMGLDRVKQVASRLSLQFPNTRIIIVGGTNGKGTTCAFLETALMRQGARVAVYSSPHLIDYRERVRYQGKVLEEQAYCDAMVEVEQTRGEVSLTYFEFGTLAGMVMMKSLAPDYILLEVGLGGRLDATNILNHDIAVLTSIGLDHQDWLGDTRELIGKEKAGIFRANKPAIIGEPDVPVTVSDYVTEVGARAVWRGSDFAHDGEGDKWSCTINGTTFEDLPRAHIPHQNIATALATLKALGVEIDRDELIECIQHTKLAGRRQTLALEPLTIADVAHNPHATVALRQWLSQFNYQRLHFVVGMLSDKARTETLAPLLDLNANWYFGATQGPRGLSGQALADCLPDTQVAKVYPSMCDAFAKAKDAAEKNDMIVVFGSFLSVAEILETQA